MCGFSPPSSAPRPPRRQSERPRDAPPPAGRDHTLTQKRGPRSTVARSMVRGQRFRLFVCFFIAPSAIKRSVISAVQGRTIWLEPRSAVTIFTKSAVPRSRGHEISPGALGFEAIA